MLAKMIKHNRHESGILYLHEDAIDVQILEARKDKTHHCTGKDNEEGGVVLLLETKTMTEFGDE